MAPVIPVACVYLAQNTSQSSSQKFVRVIDMMAMRHPMRVWDSFRQLQPDFTASRVRCGQWRCATTTVTWIDFYLVTELWTPQQIMDHNHEADDSSMVDYRRRARTLLEKMPPKATEDDVDHL